MHEMLDFGGVLVFPLDIVAIENSGWSSSKHEFLAILVTNGGARIATKLSVKEAKILLQEARRMAQKT